MKLKLFLFISLIIINFSFSQETGTVKDIDGNIYKTVKIGDQIWMAENLKVTHYSNGDKILFSNDKDPWIESCKNDKGSYCFYDNNSNNKKIYGSLYNWYVVNDKRKIAPKGWHIPSHEEWNQLINYVGKDEGYKLKSKAGWNNNENGIDIYKFNALPAGYVVNFYFHYKGENASFWTSRENWNKTLDYGYKDMGGGLQGKSTGCSIRCIKD